MNSRLSAAVLVIGALLFTDRALADCAGDTIDDKKRSYERAQTFEREGRREEALRNYRAAQGYACEPDNPYEMDAARRAAPIGMELGAAAEKKGDLRRAFEMYEAGGHYAIADRVLMEITRTMQDEPAAYQSALEHYRNRSEGFFRSNHAAALKVTGGYTPDPKYMAEVQAMPAQGVERALQKESAAFNEQYLRDYVQLIQSRPDDVLDAGAQQRLTSAQQAFVQKWKQGDLIQASREALQLVKTWGANSHDENVRKYAEKRHAILVEQRATSLRSKFYGAPKLLEDAMDYYRSVGDTPQLDGQLAAIRSQAMRLAEEADGKARYILAVEYYSVAGDDAKANAARGRQQQLTMQRMQPSIDEARSRAEAMQKQFSDPAQVEAMRQQAEAARRSLQQQQAASKQNNRKSAQELEEELGL